MRRSQRLLRHRPPLLGAGEDHDPPRATPRPKKKRVKLLYCKAQTMFLDIASDTLARIRRQREKATRHDIRSFLAYVEAHLFRPRLNVQQTCHACKIRDRSFSEPFRVTVGLTPSRYIEARRMEVAERLVRETEIKITWISFMLGYGSLKVFGNAFGRLTDERPLTYRKKCQADAFEKGLPRRSEELARIVKLRRALQGTLEPAEAARLIERLHALYPTTAGEQACQEGTPS